MVKVKNWTKLYEIVCSSIYDLEPAKFSALARKEFDEEHMTKRFSVNEKGLRTAFKVSENLYIEKEMPYIEKYTPTPLWARIFRAFTANLTTRLSASRA